MISFFKSFTYAFQGLLFGLEERSMRIHILMSLIVILLGVLFRVTPIEWLILFLCIGFVMSAELLNSAIEAVCDALAPLHTEMHKKMGKPKDLGAAGVFVSAFFSFIAGCVIFLPHIFALMGIVL